MSGGMEGGGGHAGARFREVGRRGATAIAAPHNGPSQGSELTSQGLRTLCCRPKYGAAITAALGSEEAAELAEVSDPEVLAASSSSSSSSSLTRA